MDGTSPHLGTPLDVFSAFHELWIITAGNPLTVRLSVIQHDKACQEKEYADGHKVFWPVLILTL